MKLYMKIYMHVKFQMIWLQNEVFMGTKVQKRNHCGVSP